MIFEGKTLKGNKKRPNKNLKLFYIKSDSWIRNTEVKDI